MSGIGLFLAMIGTGLHEDIVKHQFELADIAQKLRKVPNLYQKLSADEAALNNAEANNRANPANPQLQMMLQLFDFENLDVSGTLFLKPNKEEREKHWAEKRWKDPVFPVDKLYTSEGFRQTARFYDRGGTLQKLSPVRFADGGSNGTYPIKAQGYKKVAAAKATEFATSASKKVDEDPNFKDFKDRAKVVGAVKTTVEKHMTEDHADYKDSKINEQKNYYEPRFRKDLEDKILAEFKQPDGTYKIDGKEAKESEVRERFVNPIVNTVMADTTRPAEKGDVKEIQIELKPGTPEFDAAIKPIQDQMAKEAVGMLEHQDLANPMNPGAKDVGISDTIKQVVPIRDKDGRITGQYLLYHRVEDGGVGVDQNGNALAPGFVVKTLNWVRQYLQMSRQTLAQISSQHESKQSFTSAIVKSLESNKQNVEQRASKAMERRDPYL